MEGLCPDGMSTFCIRRRQLMMMNYMLCADDTNHNYMLKHCAAIASRSGSDPLHSSHQHAALTRLLLHQTYNKKLIGNNFDFYLAQ